MKFIKLIYYIISNIYLVVFTIEYETIDILKYNYDSYRNQVEKDVSDLKFYNSKSDIYAIQDIINTTIYTDDRNQIKRLDTWIIVRTFKYFNRTHMYHFQYKVDSDKNLTLITREDSNIMEGWLEEESAKEYNLIDILKKYLCYSHNKCVDFYLTKNIENNYKPVCWFSIINRKLYGDTINSLMGCYLTEKDSNLTVHLSFYSDMNTHSINKTDLIKRTYSFYYMDYSTYEQEVYLHTDSKRYFSINKKMTSYADNKIQKLIEDNILKKPLRYKPFYMYEGLDQSTIIFICLCICVFIIGLSFIGCRFCHYSKKIKKRNLLENNSLNNFKL